MAEGRLIIEVYEYDSANAVPAFEYIPCSLDACMNRNGKATLQEIIQRGFKDSPRSSQRNENKQEFLRKIEEADIGQVIVAYHPADKDTDAQVELTNVVNITMSDADARYAGKKDQKNIILRGRYRLSDQKSAVTTLRDAQRLTLIYSARSENYAAAGDTIADGEADNMKEIHLNITYLEK